MIRHKTYKYICEKISISARTLSTGFGESSTWNVVLSATVSSALSICIDFLRFGLSRHTQHGRMHPLSGIKSIAFSHTYSLDV